VNEPAWQRLDFATLPGWADDAHEAAYAAFLRSAAVMAERPPKTRALGIDGGRLAAIGAAARAAGPLDRAAARAFFERHFEPVVQSRAAPFLTGYYEPVLAGSRERTARFTVPVYRRPDDLVEVDAATRPTDLDPALSFARREPGGRLVEHPDRPAIEDGALDGRNLELAFVEDPVDAFFVHVQGSARIDLQDGGTLRIAFDGKTGHPYTSIGRRLADLGLAGTEPLTADRLRAWLKADRDAGRALMRENRSYIFFRELPALDPTLGAIAAAGAPLTPGRSLAVDRTEHTFGTPIYLAGRLPLGPEGEEVAFERLMIAQDTGSAIVGPARGDIFVGCGEAAGMVAGRIRHRPTAFVLLRPRETA
jgi:membrane-bound lytic murein transglycosylase A